MNGISALQIIFLLKKQENKGYGNYKYTIYL